MEASKEAIALMEAGEHIEKLEADKALWMKTATRAISDQGKVEAQLALLMEAARNLCETFDHDLHDFPELTTLGELVLYDNLPARATELAEGARNPIYECDICEQEFTNDDGVICQQCNLAQETETRIGRIMERANKAEADRDRLAEEYNRLVKENDRSFRNYNRLAGENEKLREALKRYGKSMYNGGVARAALSPAPEQKKEARGENGR